MITERDFQVDTFVTRNFLIPYEDNGIKLFDNNYGDLMKFIGLAWTTKYPFKRMKFEGPIVEFSQLTHEMWNKFHNDVIAYALAHMEEDGFDQSKLPKPVKLS